MKGRCVKGVKGGCSEGGDGASSDSRLDGCLKSVTGDCGCRVARGLSGTDCGCGRLYNYMVVAL